MTITEPSGACPNCGSQAAQRFCAGCGQRSIGRLTLRELFRMAKEKLLDSEQGLLPTLRFMITRPGKVPRDFIDGKRRRYLNPLTFFVLAASSQLVLIWLHGDALTSMMMQNIDAGLVERLGARGIDHPQAWVAERYLLLMQNAYTWMAAVAFVLPVALLMRLFLRKREVNLAETLVWALYTTGFMILFTGVVGIVALPLTGPWHGTVIGPAVYLLYSPFAARGCFGPGKWPTLAGLLATLCGFVTFLVAIGIGSAIMLAN